MTTNAVTVFDRLRQLEANAVSLRDRADTEPLGVDISDYGDEWCAGFLAGQLNALEAFDRILSTGNLWGPLVAVAEAMRDIRDSDESDLGTFSEFVGAVATEALAALERAVKEQP